MRFSANVTRAAIVVAATTAWFLLSLFVVTVTKSLFASGLKLPFLVTAVSNSVIVVLSAMHIRLAGIPMRVDTRTFWYAIAPAGVCTGLGFGFNSVSLEMLDLSLYTVLNCLIPMVSLVIGLCVGVERLHWGIVLAMAVACCGLVVYLARASAVEHISVVGILLNFAGTVLTSMRMSLQQALLQGSSHENMTGTLKEATAEPVNMVAMLLLKSPVCVLALLPFVVFVDVPNLVAMSMEDIGNAGLHLLAIGTIVYVMLLAEFALLARTSALTVAVLGLVKFVLQIVLASIFFEDGLDAVEWFGFLLCLSGVGIYQLQRYGAAAEVNDADEAQVQDPQEDPQDLVELLLVEEESPAIQSEGSDEAHEMEHESSEVRHPLRTLKSTRNDEGNHTRG